ncbi:hypothetical protein WMY93_021020 [Mugilogobius chulae]|uniref:Uncharacterized protein n=1 Tax=Mugilogobius chulae TaxID=88201 RepID=A0AAW0NB25_9GOBI
MDDGEKQGYVQACERGRRGRAGAGERGRAGAGGVEAGEGEGGSRLGRGREEGPMRRGRDRVRAEEEERPADRFDGIQTWLPGNRKAGRRRHLRHAVGEYNARKELSKGT